MRPVRIFFLCYVQPDSSSAHQKWPRTAWPRHTGGISNSTSLTDTLAYDCSYRFVDIQRRRMFENSTDLLGQGEDGCRTTFEATIGLFAPHFHSLFCEFTFAYPCGNSRPAKTSSLERYPLLTSTSSCSSCGYWIVSVCYLSSLGSCIWPRCIIRIVKLSSLSSPVIDTVWSLTKRE